MSQSDTTSIKTEKNLLRTCQVCGKGFSSKQSLSKHRIRMHGVKRAINPNIGINLTFQSEQDFNDWLVSEELATKTHFIVARGEKKMKNHCLITYKCNRSGTYKSKSTGKRRLKAQGSLKINKDCSASLKVKCFANHIEVKYIKEHNHEVSLGPLPVSVRDAIAEKVLSGVQDTRTSRDIRGNIDDVSTPNVTVCKSIDFKSTILNKFTDTPLHQHNKHTATQTRFFSTTTFQDKATQTSW